MRRIRKWRQSSVVDQGVELGVAEVVAEVKAGVVVSNKALVEAEAPSILTCRQGSGQGAPCTDVGGEGLIFVQSRPRVHGRIYLPPNLQARTSETGTSSVTI